MMMRHWNILDPGDHDFGVDDFKGSEQHALRHIDALPQDSEYVRHTFAAIWHIVTTDEKDWSRGAPVRYKRWRMPQGDLSIVITDARLWRTTQYTEIWPVAYNDRTGREIPQWGWGGLSAWERTDPTRSVLGEEQFAWLEKVIRTDPASFILVAGINAMHPFTHGKADQDVATSKSFADLAGFSKASADRLIELLSSREGIISVYGDVHLAAVVRNTEHRLVESCFGPVCRGPGSRRLKPDFAPKMKDWDGRPIEVLALYHDKYQDPQLTPLTDDVAFNFMELVFDVTATNPAVEFKIRRLEDRPSHSPLGGGPVKVKLKETGQEPSSFLPNIRTFERAEIWIAQTDGMPLRASRSDAQGEAKGIGLTGMHPGTEVLVTSIAGTKTASRILTTQEVAGKETVGLS